MHRIDARGHRLHALASQRKHQSRAVASQASCAVDVPKTQGQMIQVFVESLANTHRFSSVA
jgi:hypothetical protein